MVKFRVLSRIAAGVVLVVAVVAGASAASAEVAGIDWTSRTSAADNDWYSVTYGNGLFVAVAGSGTGNRVMTSPDGENWTSRTSAADNYWFSVTYGNGLFVAVAGSGTGNQVMTSPDGITWTSRTSAADNVWNSVTYGNGLFVVVANFGTGNRVMTSRSTTTQWTVINQGAPMPASGLCEGIDDTEFAYGTGVSGGWVRGWEPWVNTTIGADGQRKGGWACIRQLVNTGGDVWRIQS